MDYAEDRMYFTPDTIEEVAQRIRECLASGLMVLVTEQCQRSQYAVEYCFRAKLSDMTYTEHPYDSGYFDIVLWFPATTPLTIYDYVGRSGIYMPIVEFLAGNVVRVRLFVEDEQGEVVYTLTPFVRGF